MQLRIRDIFRRKETEKRRKDVGYPLSHSYLDKITQEEKDAFIKFMLNKGHDMSEFEGMDDVRAMHYINLFRGTDWYRRFAEIHSLYANLDPAAESLYNAREGVWNGNVEISSDMRDPPIKGYCSHCGRQMVDYDHCFWFGGKAFCFSCFTLLKKFTPIMTHHYPGCVDNGNDFDFHVWDGWEDFIKRYPPKEGWHYEWSRTHLMDVKDDQSEWWVLWNIHHPDIMRDVIEHCPEWHWSNIRS